MTYQKMLEEGLIRSGLTLRKAADLIRKESGMRIDHSYLSKLKSGTKPPASDGLNEAIAKVLNLDSVELKVAAYCEKIPPEVLDKLLKKNSA